MRVQLEILSLRISKSEALCCVLVTICGFCDIVNESCAKKKYYGLLKSFQCILKKNKKIMFDVSGFSEDIRKNFRKTHPINTTITFSHNGFTSKKVPRHPRYKRIFCSV